MRMMVRWLAGVVVVSATVAGIAACGSSDEEEKPDLGGAGSTTGSAGTTGASGGNGAGASGPCYPKDPSCGVANSSCIALTDNAASTKKQLRLGQLRVMAPNLLAKGAIPTTVVAPAVSLNLPQCYLSSPAKGGYFNWLIEIDTAAKKLKTGGAPYQQDPKAGYCFLTTKVNGIDVKPIEIDIDYDATTGAFATKGKIEKLVVPIYTSPDKDPILLPLGNGEITDGKLTENGNCIGRFKGEAGELDECQTKTSDPLSDDAYLWVDGAKLKGTITLEEADQVKVVDLSQSLCTLLTNHKGDKQPDGFYYCARTPDGKVDVSGAQQIEGTAGMEYVTLTATLAASAVKINDSCP